MTSLDSVTDTVRSLRDRSDVLGSVRATGESRSAIGANVVVLLRLDVSKHSRKLNHQTRLERVAELAALSQRLALARSNLTLVLGLQKAFVPEHVLAWINSIWRLTHAQKLAL